MMVPLSILDPMVQMCLGLMVYGPNGAGKTHLAATAKGKKLFLDDNGNWETLLKFPRTEWDVVSFPNKWSDMVSMWSDPLLDKYDTVVWDNLTGTARTLLMDAMKVIPNEKAGRTTPDTPGLRDYALAAERLRALCAMFKQRKQRQHIIAIMHERIDKDELTGGLLYGPSAPGTVPAHILSLFTEIIYLTKDSTNVRTAYLSPRAQWPAATRLLTPDKDGNLAVKNPNLADIYKNVFSLGPNAQVLFGDQHS